MLNPSGVLTHADPALHTAAAYSATAERLASSNANASAVFMAMARAQTVLENPASSATTKDGRYSIDASDPMKGLIARDNNTGATRFVDRLEDLATAVLKTATAQAAIEEVGPSVDFANGIALPKGSLEDEQIRVFGERLDRLILGNINGPWTSTAGPMSEPLMDMLVKGREKLMAKAYPVTGGGPANPFLKARYSGEETAIGFGGDASTEHLMVIHAAQDRGLDMRAAMERLVSDATSLNKSETKYAFQVHVFYNDLLDALSPTQRASTHHEPGPKARGEGIRAVIEVFTPAIEQPVFTTNPFGGFQATGKFENGADGIRHLADSFGPAFVTHYIAEKSGPIEETVEKFRQYRATPSPQGFYGAEHVPSGRSVEKMLKDAIVIARDAGVQQVMAKSSAYVENWNMSRALHINAEKTIQIIRSLPDDKVPSMFSAFAEVNKMNLRRMQDRSAIAQLLRESKKAVADEKKARNKKAVGIGR